jgi:predicted nucleic acid-binding protein
MTDFLDTNIIVYAYDTHEPVRQQTAQVILEEGIIQETAVLSAQVLGEFFVVVTSRIKNPLTADEALQVMNILCRLPVAEIDGDLVRSAIRLHKMYRLSYWDSLIVAAAKRMGCGRLLSEDLQDGMDLDGIVVVNPFFARE